MTQSKKLSPKLRRPGDLADIPVELSRSKTQLTEGGLERPNPRPIAPPPGYKKAPSLSEQMRNMIRNEQSLRAQEMGFETWEEADDFDMADDPLDPRSPYEVDFDPLQQLDELRASAAARAAAPCDSPDPGPAPAAPIAPASTPQPSSPGGGGDLGGSPASPPGDPPGTPKTPVQASPRPFRG